MQSKSLPEVLQRERNGYAQARSQSLFYESLPRYLMEASLAFGFVVIGGATYIFADSSRVISALALFAVAGFRLLPSINRIQGLILALYARIPLSLEALAVKPVLTSEKLEIKQQLESSEIRSKYMLELNEVSYRYPNSMKDSINKVTISFERGLLYAIVGPSGAGKTTFVDVCLGILKPTGGEVRELATGIRYAYVPQHTHLAGVSLEGNVALEWDDSFVDYDLARDVMGQALIENVFDGRLDQPGSPAMSGGQMQRIGISRALYRNPNFLVLDEATNALDAFTENEIVGLIEKLSTAMTVLVVAHRLSTVRNADKVIYFDEGEIKGIGTFSELQEQLPKFAEQVSLGLFLHGDEGPTLG
jgi:ABC-type multidrug transport system fused ATPase/permease subunit